MNRPVDAIISPVAPTLAPKHEKTDWWGYTSYWNLADYPAAVFPVGRSREPSDTMETEDKDGSERAASKGADDGLPICLQLVGRRLNEEKVLGMLNVIDRLRNPQ